MTNTQHFIELAIEGNYISCCDRHKNTDGTIDIEDWKRHLEVNIHEHLLSPFFWQAVGKVKQLDDDNWAGQEWKDQWFQFVSFLAEGLSIEKALGEILK